VKPNVFFGIISLIKRIPILITIPGLGSVFSSDQLKYKFYQKLILTLYKLIARNHCYFIFENPSDQNLFLNKNICSSVNSSISPGAGIDLHKFTFSTEPTLTKNKIRVLFAARMIYGKGLERLIKAVDALNMQGCNFQLDVAGILDNESHESIPEKKIIQWHQQGKINWLGQVQDIPRLLKDVNIVALPTTYAEGLPRILLEAASIGRAIITTNNAGCRSLIKHNYNGLLVNPKDTEQLIRALHAYQDRDMRASHGRRSRKIIEQKFTLNHVIDCYQKAYVTLLTKTT
jgi:glycosyltransferase involved in cell wall biosynthesis